MIPFWIIAVAIIIHDFMLLVYNFRIYIFFLISFLILRTLMNIIFPSQRESILKYVELIMEKITRDYYYFLKFFTRSIKSVDHKKKLLQKPDYCNNITDISERVKETFNRCGSLYYIFDGYQRIVMIGDYKTAKEFYKLPSYSEVMRVYPYLGYVYDNLLSKCIGSHTGKDWLDMKKPLTQFFTTRSVRYHYDFMIEQFTKWIPHVVSVSNILNLKNMMLAELTIEILSRIVYGKIEQSDVDELYELSLIHNKLMVIMGTRMSVRVNIFCNMFTNINCKLVDEFWERWSKFNDRQMERLNRNSYNDNNKIHYDTLFETMLNSSIYNCGDNTKMYQTLYEIMLFNSDIMVDSFANLIWNIASNTDVQEKIYSECKDVDVQDYMQVDSLKYLPLVINESARLNPGIVVTFAETIGTSVLLGGYEFPPNTMFSLDTQMINRDPEIWENPNAFNPLRFQVKNNDDFDKNKDHDKGKLFLFHRFGLSPRKCLGNVFGDYILTIGVITILSRYLIKVHNSGVNQIDPINDNQIDPINDKRDTIPNISNHVLSNYIEFIKR